MDTSRHWFARTMAATALLIGLGGAAPVDPPALVWTVRDARTLIAIIDDADEEGLTPADYDPAAIAAAARLGAGRQLDEVATAAALELAGDYWAGRVPVAARTGWHIAGTSRSEAVLLARIGAGLRAGRLKATFDALLPNHEDYRELREALERTGADEPANRRPTPPT